MYNYSPSYLVLTTPAPLYPGLQGSNLLMYRVCTPGLLCEFLGFFGPTLSDDVNEVIRKDKWYPLSLDTKFTLEITQEMSEIDMHQLNRRYDCTRGLIQCQLGQAICPTPVNILQPQKHNYAEGECVGTPSSCLNII